MLNSRGFTLVEILIALVIGTIILAAGYMAVMSGHQASTGIEQKISAQQDIRAALDIIATEISMASYNPTGTNGLWVNPACGAGAIANKGIQQATADGATLTVESDINENGSVNADPNELITYSYDAANERITRQAGCGGGAQSFLGDLATVSARQRNVRVVNGTLGIPLFRYFDGNNALINMPADIAKIRRIDITIAVQATVPDVQGQTRSMVYSTSVVPRNHVVTQ